MCTPFISYSLICNKEVTPKLIKKILSSQIKMASFQTNFFRIAEGKKWCVEPDNCVLLRKSFQSSFLPYCSRLATLGDIFVVPQQEVVLQGTILMPISFNWIRNSKRDAALVRQHHKCCLVTRSRHKNFKAQMPRQAITLGTLPLVSTLLYFKVDNFFTCSEDFYI